MSRQKSLEDEMVRMGQERHEAKIRRARERGQESSTPAGSRLLQNSVAQLAEALIKWIKETGARPAGEGRKPNAWHQLRKMNPHVVALVTCKAVLDQIARQQKLTSAACQLGHLIEDECRLDLYRRHDRVDFGKAQQRAEPFGAFRRRNFMLRSMKKQAPELWTDWGRALRLQVGVTCIELLAQSTGMIELRTKRDARNRNHICVTPSVETLEWIEKANEDSAVLFPFFLPCVAVPLDWHGPFGGGYAHNKHLQRPLVKTRDRRYLEELRDHDMPVVYGAINALQRTAWAVNEEVLQVMDHVWQEGEAIAGLPAREPDEIPPRPPGDHMAPDVTAWRRTASTIHLRNEAAASRRIQVAKTLFMAKKYLSLGRFWYPHKADFRGRVYAVPYFLQPQGPDDARGLLRFAEGHPVGELGANWLAVHGANCWGEDKRSIIERLAWVDANEENILAVGQDPISNTWWSEADEPWQFLAFCLEWYRYVDGGRSTEFESHIPVAMDGSNNGLQLFSLLLRDEVAGASTNCTPAGLCDTPRDIYADVAKVVTRKLYEHQTNGTEQERGWATEWLRFVSGTVPRQAVKRPVMVVPYGGTPYSAHEYVVEWFQEQVRERGVNPFPVDRWNPTRFLARLLWDAIGENIHAARACMDWLQECATVCVEHGVPIRWTSPSGFPVKQAYRKYSRRVVSTRVGEKVRYLSLREDRDQPSPRRQRNGASPNFIHSLDAAALHLTVFRLHEAGVRDFSMIHDSFAVHAAHVDTMNRTLREAYRDIFREPLLEQYRAEVQAHLPAGVTLPEPPKAGTLDVEGLVDASYFFA